MNSNDSGSPGVGYDAGVGAGLGASQFCDPPLSLREEITAALRRRTVAINRRPTANLPTAGPAVSGRRAARAALAGGMRVASNFLDPLTNPACDLSTDIIHADKVGGRTPSMQ
jgi:hypothetical protein